MNSTTLLPIKRSFTEETLIFHTNNFIDFLHVSNGKATLANPHCKDE